MVKSESRHNIRYTNMVSDGDSKAFRSLVNNNSYPVDNLECINHVCKRLGKALRYLDHVGGRGKGRLTCKKMNKLQVYYSNAVSII